MKYSTLIFVAFTFLCLASFSRAAKSKKPHPHPSSPNHPNKDNKSKTAKPEFKSVTSEPISQQVNSQSQSNEPYTDKDFLEAAEYASQNFKSCCDSYVILNNTKCSELVCKYGLDSDYMRSAFVTKCDIEDSKFVDEYLFCATASMDNYKCCRTLGINHDCCSEFMSYRWKYESFNTDKFLSQCIDIFKAIAYCPILHF